MIPLRLGYVLRIEITQLLRHRRRHRERGRRQKKKNPVTHDRHDSLVSRTN
jgi:hypothetical protein